MAPARHIAATPAQVASARTRAQMPKAALEWAGLSAPSAALLVALLIALRLHDLLVPLGLVHAPVATGVP